MPDTTITITRSRPARAALFGGLACLLAGCVQTRDVAGPGPGHPAHPASESAEFVMPSSLFARSLAPVGSDESTQSHQRHGPPSRDAGNSDLTTYICPMHTDVRSDRPGKCPICGMQLVPHRRSEETHEHGGAP